MNISKAKSVMIVVFLALNFFLIIQLLEPGWGSFEEVIYREERQRAESMLAANNYRLDAHIPSRAEKSFFLTVMTPDKDIEAIKARFFNGGKPKEQETEEGVLLTYEGATLKVHKSGLISYRPRVEEPAVDSSDEGDGGEQDAYKRAFAFLEKRELLFQEPYRYEILKNPLGGYSVVFYQEYNDVPLFSGYARVNIDEGAVTGAWFYRHRIVGMQDRQEMEIIPATMALMRLMEEVGRSESEKLISRIEPGFYSREYDAEQWEIPPVWRVSLEDGTNYFINAFTGNIENKETGL